tara:strand:- start:18 stop:299 length:282 start_codon:yes stop_codon:yes gene_type:complete
MASHNEDVLTTPEPQTSGDESVIELLDGTADLVTTNVIARNVGELRETLGLRGSIVVNGIVSSDSTPIRSGESEADRDEVVHVFTDKKGGDNS